MKQGLRQSSSHHPGIQAYPRAPPLLSFLAMLSRPNSTRHIQFPHRAGARVTHTTCRLRARYMQARYSGLLAQITYGYNDFGGPL